MKRLLVLFVVAVFTILILFFFTNPELLDKVWLWLIGLAGYVLILLEKGFKAFKDALNRGKKVDSIPSDSSLSNLHPDQGQQSHIKRLEDRVHHIEQKLKEKENHQSFLSGSNQKDRL